MRLNTIKPNKGAKKQYVRVGRGGGSGLGKTCGRGHKGQKARAGGFHKVGFEGGQMPLQRRLPKFGFTSMTAPACAEIRLHELNKIDSGKVTIETLRQANIISAGITRAKIILSGTLEKKLTVSGISVTGGARKAIESKGGSID